MAGHVGTKCIVCSKTFTSEDDVVICPECGTPYHRECYLRSGKCVNDELHKRGGTWQPSYDADGSGDTAVVCRFCGYTNPPLTLFCRRCGMPSAGINNEADKREQRYAGANINDDSDAYNMNYNSGTFFRPYVINFSDPLCGLDPEEDYDGVRLAELGDFVGTNTHYYIPLFKQFKDMGRKFSLNFPAMIFPELYFSYRKMPLLALAALVMRILSNIPNWIYVLADTKGYGLLSEFASRFDVTSPAFRGVMMIGMVFSYAIMFTFGLFGNRFYFDNSLKKIKKIKERYGGGDVRAAISEKGGTSGLLLALFICLSVLPYLALYFVQFFSMLSAG